MAWAQCAFSSSLLPPSTYKPIISIKTSPSPSLPPPSLSKPTRRKNTLRPKILKTLTKPIQTPPQQHNLEIVNPNLNDLTGEPEPEKEELVLSLQAETVEPLPFLETEGFKFKITTRSVLYFLGFFVLQTVIAVWFLDSVENNKNQQNTNSEEEDGKIVNNFKKAAKVNGDDVYVEESELDNKIWEIRAMAREARASEAKEAKKWGVDDSEESSSDVMRVKEDENVSKTYIQKEVDGRLSKVEKKLKSSREKLIESSVGYLNGSDKSNDKKQLDVKDEKMVFEKKFKFKGAAEKPENSPKGFQSVKGSTRKSRGETEGRDSRNGSVVLDVPNGASHGSRTTTTVSKVQEKEGGRDSSGNELVSFNERGKKLEKKGETLESGTRIKNDGISHTSGEIQETSRVLNPRESSELMTNNSPSFEKDVENKPTVKRFKDKRTNIDSGMWWTRLPYALAIYMSRDSENGGPSGLYSLKIDNSSYRVVFEDRDDAINFCYIVESFFEELDDVSVDIVPLPKEELIEAAKSSTMKLIVVRRGQLKLYAGQPLEDVELALRSYVR